jgi:hypothetical protein
MHHRVVYVMSTNFAGSTLLGLVIGSHSEARFLGEPAHVVRRDGTRRWVHDNVCAICQGDWHRSCPVWKPLLVAQIRERPEQTYDLLAAGWPKRYLMVDSSKDFEWLEAGNQNPNVDAIVVHISKSVHQYAASILTRREALPPIEAIGLEWARANEAIRSYAMSNSLPYSHVRYSDLVQDFEGTLQRLGAFLGLDPQAAQREFWLHPHHYVKGNSGTTTHFDASRIEDEPGINRELYRNNHRKIFLDNKWKELLSRRDLVRLLSLPQVERETERFGHDLPGDLHVSAAARVRARLAALAINSARRTKSLFSASQKRDQLTSPSPSDSRRA